MIVQIESAVIAESSNYKFENGLLVPRIKYFSYHFQPFVKADESSFFFSHEMSI